MAASPKGDFFDSSKAAVKDHELQRKLESASTRHLDHFAIVKAEFPSYEDEKDAAHRIKTDAIAHLDELLIQLTDQLQKNGCKVFFAENAAEARKYIVDLATAKGATRVVKGKSMTTEEIELNPAFKAAGIDPVETDLGEYIVQLRGEGPSHIITPAIHLSKEDIGHLFSEQFGIEYTAEPEKLTAEARERLRAIFLAAEFGITGVNFAIAETGTMVVVENEGNGRLSSSMPDTFVAIMGIEKVIPRLDDLSPFLEILARTATGQKLTTYTSFITGPRREGELDGPREMHVVILDNGRSTMLADPVLREALNCIRCGACLNVCPIYRRIGGHAYKSVYPGPIGSIVSPNLFGSAAGYLPFASTLCGACKDICPVKIDIPRILLHLRWKETEGAHPLKWPATLEGAREGARRFAGMARHPRTIRMLGRFAAQMLKPFTHNGYLRKMPSTFGGWMKYRNFPRPHPHKRRPATLDGRES
jgi:L-lactate dehydrogenase complex protein LldF